LSQLVSPATARPIGTDQIWASSGARRIEPPNGLACAVATNSGFRMRPTRISPAAPCRPTKAFRENSASVGVRAAMPVSTCRYPSTAKIAFMPPRSSLPPTPQNDVCMPPLPTIVVAGPPALVSERPAHTSSTPYTCTADCAHAPRASTTAAASTATLPIRFIPSPCHWFVFRLSFDHLVLYT
jgi:hypothetical protein